MNRPTIAEVEAAVRAVLRRGDHDATADVFAGPVLSLRHAESLAATASEIRITAGTVVTPLAREILKQNGIALRVVGRRIADRAGEWGLAIGVESGITVALRRVLLADEREMWAEIGTSHRDAARWVAGNTTRSAVAITDEASIATWEACRIEGVRAATVHDADSAARAARKLGANLLVVEIGGQTIASLRQIASAFRRTDRRETAMGGTHEDR